MRSNLFLICFLFLSLNIFSQAIDRTAVIGLPRLSNAEMNGIDTANTGSVVFNTDTLTIHYYDGTNWISINTGAPVVLNAYLDFDQFIGDNNINNIRYNEIRTNIGGFPNPLNNQNSVTIIPQDGIYEISHTATIDRLRAFNNDPQSRDFETNLLLNGNIIPGTKSMISIVDDSFGNVSHNLVIRLSRGDEISVSIQRFLGRGNYTILEDSAQLTVKLIN